MRNCWWWKTEKFIRFHQLTHNKRAEEDPEFAEFVLAIGNGTYGKIEIAYSNPSALTADSPSNSTERHPASVDLPSHFLLPRYSSLEDLVEWVYENRQCSDIRVHNLTLHLVDNTLNNFSLNVQKYMLEYIPDVDEPSAAQTVQCSKEYEAEKINEQQRAEAERLYEAMPNLTEEQDVIFNEVIECVNSDASDDAPNVFYVDGPAGAGKTFLYTTILRYLRAQFQFCRMSHYQ